MLIQNRTSDIRGHITSLCQLIGSPYSGQQDPHEFGTRLLEAIINDCIQNK